MLARIVTLVYEDGRWFADGRRWLEERLAAAGDGGGAELHSKQQYWLVNGWEAKVVSVAIYETNEALEASEAPVAATLEAVRERFPPLSETVEVFRVVASRP